MSASPCTSPSKVRIHIWCSCNQFLFRCLGWRSSRLNWLPLFSGVKLCRLQTNRSWREHFSVIPHTSMCLSLMSMTAGVLLPRALACSSPNVLGVVLRCKWGLFSLCYCYQTRAWGSLLTGSTLSFSVSSSVFFLGVHKQDCDSSSI